MNIRYLGGLPGIGGPRDTEVEKSHEGLRIKRGGFRNRWVEVPRESILGVSYVPEGGKTRTGTGTDAATGALVGLGAPLLGLAIHALGRKKSGLIVMQVRLEGDLTVDVLFEAAKRERTYSDFTKLLRE